MYLQNARLISSRFSCANTRLDGLQLRRSYAFYRFLIQVNLRIVRSVSVVSVLCSSLVVTASRFGTKIWGWRKDLSRAFRCFLVRSDLPVKSVIWWWIGENRMSEILMRQKAMIDGNTDIDRWFVSWSRLQQRWNDYHANVFAWWRPAQRQGRSRSLTSKGGLFLASKHCLSVLSGAILVIVGHTFRPSYCETCVATVCWRVLMLEALPPWRERNR